MRGFGRSERVPIDATRGLRHWSDDVTALLRSLGIDASPHMAGTGGGTGNPQLAGRIAAGDRSDDCP